MTVTLMDDEQPALKMMEILLNKYPQIKISGQFTNPMKALEEIPALQPDVVFLDIDMPCMNGMDVAAGLLEVCPNTRIVFVTAHEQYALEAYQFHPMDYILKPVDEARLEKLMEYLLRSSQTTTAKKDKKLLIRCFKDFYIKWEDQEPIQWRTEKTEEILAYLLDNYGHQTAKDMILDTLWPDDAPDKSVKQLYNGIYYIRKSLSEYGVGNRIVIDKSYNLKLNDVDFDLNALENMLCDCDANFEKIYKMMDGMYFEKQDYLWATEKREDYFSLYLQCLMKLAAGYLDNHLYEQAIKLYLKALNKDPLNEDVAEKLLRLYLLTGNKIKGMQVYQTYEKLMKAELNEKPSNILMDCYHILREL